MGSGLVGDGWRVVATVCALVSASLCVGAGGCIRARAGRLYPLCGAQSLLLGMLQAAAGSGLWPGSCCAGATPARRPVHTPAPVPGSTCARPLALPSALQWPSHKKAIFTKRLIKTLTGAQL